jgi:hypothetical protein
MPIPTAYSTKELPEAIADLKQQCGDCKPRVVICFASAKYDPAGLSEQMAAAFPDACVIGCSTAGEICSGQMMSGSVVAMFLDEDVVEDAACAVLENASGETCVREAFSELQRHFGVPVSEMDIDKYAGLILADGLSGAEERLMEKIGDLTDLFFVGGSAGDDLKFQKTYVLTGGKAYTNAAVLALLRLKKGFGIVKTQSFKTTGKLMLATEVDEAARKVIRFNGKPALDAYAEALGVAPEQAAALFMRHPLGLMVEGEPFVRSPQRVEDRSILFYCQIKEGMELEILDATDIVADTRAAVEAKKAELGEVAGVIDFDCILRTLELRDENLCGQYGGILSGVPAVGFSTYGEEYLGHLNQTATMLFLR